MINITNMKYIRFLGVLLSLVVNTAVLHAQGFAGPDKSELVRMGDSATITLGNGSGGSGYCYTWFVSEELLVGNSDVHQPTITIRVGEGEYNFRVMRLSLCDGKEEDEVHVVVRSTIHLVSASPKYACYNEGDYIFNEQFDIVTDPIGYGHLANVQPTVAQITMEEGNNQTVTFSLTHNGVTTYASCQIYVLDPMVEVQSGPTFDLLGIQTALDFINGKCAKIINSIGGPCELSPSINGDLFPSIRFREMCCRDHTPNTVCEVSSGGWSVGVGTTCRFPIAGIPYIASLDVVFRLSGDVALNPFTGVLSFNDECGTDLCYSGAVSISAEGGIGGSLIGGKVASADITLGGSGSVSFTKCIKSRNNLCPRLNLEIYAAGTVCLLSFVSHSFRFPLYQESILVNL